MRTVLLAFLQVVVPILLLPSPGAHAQALPSDFKFSITVGGTAPWKAKTTITIDSAGAGHYVRYKTGGHPVTLADTAFSVSMTDLQNLWKTIQDSSFFTLTSAADTSVGGGEFAKVIVSGGGTTHQVILRNVALPKLQAVIGALNAGLPATLRVSYSPPGSFNITPVDPCGTPVDTTGAQGKVDQFRSLHHPDPKLTYWFERRISAVAASSASVRTLPSPSSTDAAAIVPHAGTVVAYNIPIQDAVRKHIAKLSSKGEFFGDGVSITVDNTHTPPSNTISITLYLEFYGPLATPANIEKIEQDIAKKWDGMKTSSGKKIDLGFVTRSDAGSLLPPSTPGYHQINLVPADSVRSYVGGGPKPNAGVGDCVWELDQDPGTYAHEAGHLMGLPDRYVDYNKQADGRWVNSETNQAYASDNAFATYLVSKYPGMSVNDIKNQLKNEDTYSVPLDGSENDLMAEVDKPARQSDIDKIASDPGVLVTVPPGTIFVNRDHHNQNVVVTHEDDLFVKKGERRTQNGIYVACVDHSRGVPTKNTVFDIAPPLETWKGVKAARSMASLTQYLDSAGLFCGTSLTAQEAVWRISDNSLGNSSVDDLLHAAGVTLGDQEVMDFPHMTPPPSNDTSSNTFIPNELFVAQITPQLASGTVDSVVHFSASVAVPTEAGAMLPTFAWSAMAPDSTPAPIIAADSTATLTTSRSGIYEVGLRFSYNDSLLGQRSFTSNRKSYVIVPDANTETFEHAALADKFPWTSLGDVPWTISNISAQTGAFAARAGSVSGDQRSTLAVTVVVPTDGVVSFSVRTALPDAGQLIFYIDSTYTDWFDGLSDWLVVREPLTAGRHLLSWTYWTLFAGSTPTPVNAWVDNIFLPGTAVVTEVGNAHPVLPHEFVLEQNYPNPFNPSTMIRYGLPHRAMVSLSVFNTLGQKAAELVHGVQEAGYHEALFDGSKLSSGVYFYTLRAESFVETRKLLLVK